MFRRIREYAARKQASNELIEQMFDVGELPRRHSTILRVALRGLEGSNWLFPSQKPHKMHQSEAAEHVRSMNERLRSIRSHLVDIAIEATALKQFSDEFPEDYAKLPEELRTQADQWIALLRFDDSDPQYQSYQKHIRRLSDGQSE